MNGRMKALSAVLAIVALIGLVGSGMTINDVLGAKSYFEQKDIESTENLNKLDDGLKTLQENEQAYLDGKKDYEQGQIDLAEGEKTLADGYAQYEQGKKDYADGEAKLAAGKKKLDENKDAYEQGKKDYAAGVKRLADGKKTLDAGKDALATLKKMMAGIAQLNDGYSTAWRPGYEAVNAAGYVSESGNLDKEAAKEDKANLESAIAAYEGVTGLEDNGASPQQAQAMAVAGVMQEKEVDQATAAAMVSNALNNADQIKAVHAAVDKLVEGYSDEEAFATAESGVLNAMKADGAPDDYKAAAAAYEAVSGAMAQGASLDDAVAGVAFAKAKAQVENNPEAMAKIESAVKEAAAQAGIDEETDPVAYEQFVNKTKNELIDSTAASYVTPETLATLKGAYNSVLSNVNDKADEIKACKGNQDAAVAFVADSQGKTEDEIATAYAGYDIVESYARLQKPTKDGGITHDEAVAAVASVAGVLPAAVETGYQTVKGMGTDKVTPVDAANANVNKLDDLSKDGGQIDQLNAGRNTIQSNLNTILNGIAGNDAFAPYVSPAEVKTLKSLINGSDAQFEVGSDAFFKKAASLSPLVDSVEKQVNEGQITYNEGVKALKAGKAKLKEYEDGMATYKQGVKDLAAGAAKLADAEKQLADGEKALADGKQQLADGAAKLAEYEDGVAQVKDGLQQVVDTEADPGIESIAERLGSSFSHVDANGDLDIPQGFVALDSAWAYKADDGDAIGNELYIRIYGAVAALVASIMALVAAFLGFKKKYKGALPCAGISAVAAAAASVFAKKAGLYFSAAAGSTMGPIALYAGAVLAVVALIHAIGDGAAAKAE